MMAEYLEISHHNGDPYGEKTIFLDSDSGFKKLTSLQDNLLNRIISFERNQMQKEASKEEHAKIIKNLKKKFNLNVKI